MTNAEKSLVFAFAEYMRSKNVDGNNENISTIVQLLEKEFGVEEVVENFMSLSYYPTSLESVFSAGVEKLGLKNYSESLSAAEGNPKYDAFVDVVRQKGYYDGAEEGSLDFTKRHAKLLHKFKAKAQESGSTVEDNEKLAEEYKSKGNVAINSKNYEEAIRWYTEALKLSSNGPNSHIYYCNRAAAYCYANLYLEAVDDCQSCIALSPDYVKAYSRLGLSNFFLERYDEAVEAYEKAVELEPDNKSSKDSLRQARNKLKKVSAAPAAVVNDAPDLSSMASMLSGGNTPAGLAGMMNNPAMKQAMDKVGGTAGEHLCSSTFDYSHEQLF